MHKNTLHKLKTALTSHRTCSTQNNNHDREENHKEPSIKYSKDDDLKDLIIQITSSGDELHLDTFEILILIIVIANIAEE